jgi:hypothetical protein
VNFYGYVRGNPVSRADPLGLADLSYFRAGTPQAAVAKLWTEEGYYTVAGHGAWGSWALLDERGNVANELSIEDLTEPISKDAKWRRRPVRLGFCWAGRGKAREELEKLLRVPVEATTEKLMWDPNAEYTPDAPYVIDPKGGGYRRPTWSGSQPSRSRR